MAARPREAASGHSESIRCFPNMSTELAARRERTTDTPNCIEPGKHKQVVLTWAIQTLAPSAVAPKIRAAGFLLKAFASLRKDVKALLGIPKPGWGRPDAGPDPLQKRCTMTKTWHVAGTVLELTGLVSGWAVRISIARPRNMPTAAAAFVDHVHPTALRWQCGEQAG